MNANSQNTELIQKYLVHREPRLREEIILRHVPLVHFVLGRLGLSQNMGSDYEDAASQGLLGLIEALDRFDPCFGAQFSTYATLRIRGKVIDHLRSLDWLSRGARKRARQVQEAMAELWEKFERPPSEEELAQHLQINLPVVQQALLDASRVFVSLDTMSPESSADETSLHEMLADPTLENPCQALEEEELQMVLVDEIKQLPRRDQLILALYYHQELTFKEIGQILSISESRVCQLHGRLLLRLRARLSQHTLPA